MKSVAALALIGSAAAFAPAQTGKASTQLNAVSWRWVRRPLLHERVLTDDVISFAHRFLLITIPVQLDER